MKRVRLSPGAPPTDRTGKCKKQKGNRPTIANHVGSPQNPVSNDLSWRKLLSLKGECVAT
jgi:hypothetical protein